jgi:hypothetical protein
MFTFGTGAAMPNCRATHSCSVRPAQAALPLIERFCAMA